MYTFKLRGNNLRKRVKDRMKTAVIYNSQTGFTKRYAKWISDDIGADIIRYLIYITHKHTPYKTVKMPHILYRPLIYAELTYYVNRRNGFLLYRNLRMAIGRSYINMI